MTDLDVVALSAASWAAAEAVEWDYYESYNCDNVYEESRDVANWTEIAAAAILAYNQALENL